MDKKIKEIDADHQQKVIKGIHYTLLNYPHPEDLEWGTKEVKTLLSRIKELEEAIRRHKNTQVDTPKYTMAMMELRDEELYKVLKEHDRS